MYQQPLFVDVHNIKETARASETETRAAPKSSLILPELLDQIHGEFRASLSEATIRRFNGRLERALDMAKKGSVGVTEIPGKFYVSSAKRKGTVYQVDLNNKTCTCPDFNAGNICKHRVASYYIQQALFQSGSNPLEDQEKGEEPPHDISQLDEILLNANFPRPKVWAMADYAGQLIPVEILETNTETFYVCALPEIVDGKLVPRFPFASPFKGSDVPYSTAFINRDQVSCVKIFGG